mgnify:CR=1 FL=1
MLLKLHVAQDACAVFIIIYLALYYATGAPKPKADNSQQPKAIKQIALSQH